MAHAAAGQAGGGKGSDGFEAVDAFELVLGDLGPLTIFREAAETDADGAAYVPIGFAGVFDGVQLNLVNTTEACDVQTAPRRQEYLVPFFAPTEGDSRRGGSRTITIG